MIIQSSILGSLHSQLHPEMNGIPSDGVLPGKKFLGGNIDSLDDLNDSVLDEVTKDWPVMEVLK